MQRFRQLMPLGIILVAVAISGCSSFGARKPTVASLVDVGPSSNLEGLILKYSVDNQVPESLVRRVVKRESNYNPGARNGVHMGLMQIRHDTARGMGYKGTAGGLLDAETNLKYGVKYLAGAYKVADGNQDRAVQFYSRGYYYDAKRKGMLDEVGLR